MSRASATDHRAVVLESVATAPTDATLETIVKDAAAIGWTERKQINTMALQLVHEGLLGRKENGSYFVTQFGLARLIAGDFGRKVAEFAPRPRSRKKKFT